jgi:hypothetical protein
MMRSTPVEAHQEWSLTQVTDQVGNVSFNAVLDGVLATSAAHVSQRGGDESLKGGIGLVETPPDRPLECPDDTRMLPGEPLPGQCTLAHSAERLDHQYRLDARRVEMAPVVERLQFASPTDEVAVPGQSVGVGEERLGR